MINKYLEKNKFYMNPVTGSVDTGEGWEKSYAYDTFGLSFEEWCGEDLVKLEE